MTEALSLRQFAGLKLLEWSGLAKQFGPLSPPLSSLVPRGNWWPFIRESYTGAWQQNVTIELANVLSHPTVFACITLIASDIAKMQLRLLVKDASGVWEETESAAFSPVLRKPNSYQLTIEFIRSWVMSKLIYGNSYVLLVRDLRQVVRAMHVLDPTRVQVLLAPNGDVYYQLKRDDLSRQFEDGFVVPASEIIHDKMNTLNHPLVGLSPIYACGLAAVLGLKIQTNSANLFNNAASPMGTLNVPTAIDQGQADRLKANFMAATSGSNYGAVAILTNGMEYKPITQSAVDSQLIDQWKATSEAVCAAFHVPGHMVGVGDPPTVGTNVQSLAIQYFAQALQEPAECIEDHLDYALGLTEKIDGRQLGVGFDHDDLFWMDTATMVENEAKKVGAGIASPNEARKKFDAKPVEGGDTPYLQEQNWPLRLLSARELPTRPPTAPEPIEEPDEDEEDIDDEEMNEEDVEKAVADLLRKELELAA